MIFRLSQLLLSIALLNAFIATSHAEISPINEITQRLAQPNVLTGKFAQEKHLKILKAPLRSDGEFGVEKDKGVLWSIKRPVSSVITITPDGVSGPEIQSERANKSIAYIGNILNQVLTGKLSSLEEQFDIVDAKLIDKTHWQLELKPRSLLLAKAIAHVKLTGSQFVEHLELGETSGDKTVIHFSGLEQAEQLPESMSDAFNK